MSTTSYAESDAKKSASLSRHFLAEESDVENDAVKIAFSARVKTIIGNDDDKSIRAFALKAGISPSVLRQYCLGKSLPGLERLIAIAKTGNVNLLWLATGEGPMLGSIPHESMPCHGHLDGDALRKAFAMVESLGRDKSLDWKTRALAAFYEFYAAEQPYDPETLRRLVASLI